MTFQLGGLAQVVHVTDDLARARELFADVLGGICYYEGYSPYEKRDASIYAIADLTFEPMSPSDEPDAGDLPVGRFLRRFGAGLQSIAINATGIRELAQHLLDAGVRVVGPGGIPLEDMSDRIPMAIYTHPRDSHFLMELVDFGDAYMPGSPRLRPDYDAGAWRTHPVGITGLQHITALVRDVEVVREFLHGVLGATILDDVVDEAGPGSTRTQRVRIGTETVVQLCQPLEADSELSRRLAADGEGLLDVTLGSVDPDAAARYLSGHGVRFTRRADGAVLLDPASTAGAPLVLVPA